MQTRKIQPRLIAVLTAALGFLVMLTAAVSCSSSTESPAIISDVDSVPNVGPGTTQNVDTTSRNDGVEDDEGGVESERDGDNGEDGGDTGTTSGDAEREPGTSLTTQTSEVGDPEPTDDNEEPEGSSANSTTTTFQVDLEEPAFNANSPVSTVGIGDVFFGMKPSLAAREAETEWIGSSRIGSDCYLIQPINGPEDVKLWVYKGHIEGVSVENSTIRTSSGLGVGTTQSELREAFGAKLVVGQHPSRAAWTQAVFTPEDDRDASFRVLFDLDESGEVVRYWSGRVDLAFLSENEMFDREEC